MERTRDSQYTNLPYSHSEIDHAYGENIHIISTPYMMTALARVCSKDTTQPEANRLFRELYTDLLKNVVNAEMRRVQRSIPSRMIEFTERGYYEGDVIDPEQKVVVGSVARAGLLPAQEIFDQLNLLIDPAGVRLDYFFVSRVTDDDQHVTGASVASAKIGGPLDDAILLLPDPMGATGSSMIQTLESYRDAGVGISQKTVVMHLIVTPEYIRAMKSAFPDVRVYAIRLDRGLSAPDVLAERPGVRWDEERGLTDLHYIVPGGGGIGEVMTNSWV